MQVFKQTSIGVVTTATIIDTIKDIIILGPNVDELFLHYSRVTIV